MPKGDLPARIAAYLKKNPKSDVTTVHKAIGGDLSNVRNTISRMVKEWRLHVSAIEHKGMSKKNRYSFGPEKAGFVPEVIEVEAKQQQGDNFGRYASVWDYARGAKK